MRSRVIHGDCYEVLPHLPAGFAQTVFCDPPYNFAFDYGNGRQQDLLPREEYLAKIERLLRECVRLLTATGGVWLLGPECWADAFGTMLSELLPRRNRIIWRETFGQYRESAFPSGHRHLFWHVMDRKSSFFDPDPVRVPSRRMLAGDKRAAGPRVPDDVWEIPRVVGNAGERVGDHPCQLPEALLERVVLCSTRRDDAVLDPMAGTGTALRVAQRLGRRYIGVEEQERFVAAISKRLAQPYQQELLAV